MLLKKLTIKNFKKFKEASIDFSVDPDHNVTIIHGETGYGKTTVVKAILWCLYKENDYSNKILLNSEVQDNMVTDEEKPVVVTIVLEHNGFRYEIETTQIYKMKANRSVSPTSDPVTRMKKIPLGALTNFSNFIVPEGLVKGEINSILRSELKNYFFFEGENNRISSVSSQVNLKEAVVDILNMHNVKLLGDYFSPNRQSLSVLPILEGKIKGEGRGMDALEINRINQLDNLRITNQQNIEKRNNNEAEIEKLTGLKNHDEEILNNGAETLQYQQEKKEIEDNLARATNNKESNFDAMLKTLSVSSALIKMLYTYSYCSMDLENKLSNTSFSSGSSYEGITAKGVDYLIDRGECVCGAKIEKNSDIYNHLIEAKDHMEPMDFSNHVRDFKDFGNLNISSSKTNIGRVREMAIDEEQYCDQIDMFNASKRDVESHIIDNTDYGQYQKSVLDYQLEITRLEQSVSDLNETIEKTESDISTLQTQVMRQGERNRQNDLVKKRIEYANEIYKRSQIALNQSKELMRADLQDEVQNVFDDIYGKGLRQVNINGDFKADPLTNGRSFDLNAGLGMDLNYSFVLGLMRLAKKSAKSNKYQTESLEDEDAVEHQYPLVIDAPFSENDTEHIEKICKILPSYCDQVILLMMDKDYDHAVKSIGDKVGKEYQIERLSETESVIREGRR